MNVVVTTIFPPTTGTRLLSARLSQGNGRLWILGDRKGPVEYDLPATEFWSIDAQQKLPWQLAKLLPEKHYTRKNLGYLLAIQTGCEYLVETDDDNIPQESFWEERHQVIDARSSGLALSWFNVYEAFTDQTIWPRGYPLEFLNPSSKDRSSLDGVEVSSSECLIQQGLADGDPDVDAVYRMTRTLPFQFDVREPVRLEKDCWCPFNSQNTTFFREAFPLLDLPSHCSFRMTDIWRSFVAQRCLWEMDSTVCFTQASMFQERNEHDLLRDFSQEVSGYLHNHRIAETLRALSLQPGRETSTVLRNLTACYEALVSLEVVPAAELSLVSAWCEDFKEVSAAIPAEMNSSVC